MPGAFVCNIGDCLMRWTNDIYVSTPHRVVSPAGRERYSIAFFLDPNPDAEIACLPNCASDARPARYAPIRGDAFLLGRLSPTYEKSGLGGATPQRRRRDDDAEPARCNRILPVYQAASPAPVTAVRPVGRREFQA